MLVSAPTALLVRTIGLFTDENKAFAVAGMVVSVLPAMLVVAGFVLAIL